MAKTIKRPTADKPATNKHIYQPDPRREKIFELYRDLGPGRSFRKLIEAVSVRWPANPLSLGTLSNWSAKFDWKRRIEEYESGLRMAQPAAAPLEAAAGDDVVNFRDPRNSPMLKDLYGDQATAEAMKAIEEDMLSWIESNPGREALAAAERLSTRLPAEIRHIGLAGAKLSDDFKREMRRMFATHGAEFTALKATYAEAHAAEKNKMALFFEGEMARYMKQRVVAQLSTFGIIPTYSFPVKNVPLEIIRDPNQRAFAAFAASDDELQLNRDGALAITEYAPGAQVVAGGRVWESAGIAAYPEEFGRPMFYRVCGNCNYASIAGEEMDLALICPVCRLTAWRPDRLPQRRFLEPKGFVTSCEKPEGEDPGDARIRSKLRKRA